MSISKIIAEINHETDKELTLFNREFKKVMKKLEALAVSFVGGDPLTFDMEFNIMLKKAGYFKLINDLVDRSYNKTLKEIVEKFDKHGIGVTLDKEDIKTITALKHLDYDYFVNVGKEAGQQLKKDLYKFTLSDMKKEDIIANLTKTLQGTNLAKYSYTYAETSISKFNQSIIDLKSKGADGVWVYVGVNDNATRSFCKCLLGQNKYYDDSDKVAIQNDTRRQWNCRHILLKLDESEAIEDGYTKGGFTC